MTIHCEKINEKNFNTHSLDHFVRHQRVSECWRNVDGQWKLIPIEFEENWTGDPKSSQYIKTNLKEADRRIARDIVNRFGK